MGSREALRVITTVIGGGVLGYALLSVTRGTLYDSDDGIVDRRSRPMTFWFLIGSMTLLALSILSVGWGFWPNGGASSR